MQAPKIIIDIGSGLSHKYITIMKDPNIHILCFEPHPILYNQLCKMKSKWISNDCGLKTRFVIADQVISNATRQNVDFYIFDDIFDDPFTSSLSPPPSRFRDCAKKIKVQTKTLCDVYKEYNLCNLGIIDLLNIDFTGDATQILNEITPNLFRKIKRIIIDAFDTLDDFDTLDNKISSFVSQAHTTHTTDTTDTTEIIDILNIHDFDLIKAIHNPTNKKTVLEFVNNTFQLNSKNNLHSFVVSDVFNNVSIQYV